MSKKTKGSASKLMSLVGESDTIMTPIDGATVCFCGCGLIADGYDWDTGAPASWKCFTDKALKIRKKKSTTK